MGLATRPLSHATRWKGQDICTAAGGLNPGPVDPVTGERGEG